MYRSLIFNNCGSEGKQVLGIASLGQVCKSPRQLLKIKNLPVTALPVDQVTPRKPSYSVVVFGPGPPRLLRYSKGCSHPKYSMGGGFPLATRGTVRQVGRVAPTHNIEGGIPLLTRCTVA